MLPTQVIIFVDIATTFVASFERILTNVSEISILADTFVFSPGYGRIVKPFF